MCSVPLLLISDPHLNDTATSMLTIVVSPGISTSSPSTPPSLPPDRIHPPIQERRWGTRAPAAPAAGLALRGGHGPW